MVVRHLGSLSCSNSVPVWSNQRGPLPYALVATWRVHILLMLGNIPDPGCFPHQHIHLGATRNMQSPKWYITSEFAELGLLYDKKASTAEPAPAPSGTCVRQPPAPPAASDGGPRSSSKSMAGKPEAEECAAGASADAMISQMEIRRVYQRCVQVRQSHARARVRHVSC